jgi:glycosyltransferase involved in cell wall biosynthesis
MIFFIAINNIGVGLSGGDTIWVNLAKRWKKVQIIGSFSTYKTMAQEGLELIFHPWVPRFEVKNPFSLWGIFKNTAYKLWHASKTAFKLRNYFSQDDVIYSASDFLPDVIPALILKLNNRRIKWVAAFYLFAPVPLSTGNPYQGDVMRFIGFWLGQRVSYPLIRHFADVVFVTSEPDRKKFKKAIVVKGGIETPIEIEQVEKKYAAIFIGRFHHQKGVLELMEIWRAVNQVIPTASLICVGDGALLKKCKEIAPHTVTFAGFLYGLPLIALINQSRVALHPATFDSGGMAMAQAMSYALPGVAFDLEAHKTYYEKGVLKVPNKDINQFAHKIIHLLTDAEFYNTMSKEAYEYSLEWNWDKRAKDIWNHLTQFLSVPKAEV